MAGPKVKHDPQALYPIICDKIAGGGNLTQICQEPGMPSHQTFLRWTLDIVEVAEEYARAREARADSRADRIDALVQRMLSGEIDPQQCRVAIDAEKWQAGKEQPKRYGDKLELGGDIGINRLSDEQIEAKLAALTAKLQADKD